MRRAKETKSKFSYIFYFTGNRMEQTFDWRQWDTGSKIWQELEADRLHFLDTILFVCTGHVCVVLVFIIKFPPQSVQNVCFLSACCVYIPIFLQRPQHNVQCHFPSLFRPTDLLSKVMMAKSTPETHPNVVSSTLP